MSLGFERGRTYNRKADIHGRFGGPQQGGIITPNGHPVVILITGQEGLEYGYGDRYRRDGVFEYFGEGQVGDKRLRAGNKAIAEHSAVGKSLLLFRKSPGGVTFEGEMICEGYHFKVAPDRKGTQRNAIVFELRHLEAIADAVEPEDEGAGLNLDALLALDAANLPTDGMSQVRNVYQRSRDVKRYVLTRANGHCEGCGSPAPFFQPDGSPYLEPHHLRRVSDGGPDHPAHVIALCPNCHRRVHAGIDGSILMHV
jgi:5-methylcytosine-specific restriction protein A